MYTYVGVMYCYVRTCAVYNVRTVHMYVHMYTVCMYVLIYTCVQTRHLVRLRMPSSHPLSFCLQSCQHVQGICIKIRTRQGTPRSPEVRRLGNRFVLLTLHHCMLLLTAARVLHSNGVLSPALAARLGVFLVYQLLPRNFGRRGAWGILKFPMNI